MQISFFSEDNPLGNKIAFFFKSNSVIQIMTAWVSPKVFFIVIFKCSNIDSVKASVGLLSKNCQEGKLIRNTCKFSFQDATVGICILQLNLLVAEYAYPISSLYPRFSACDFSILLTPSSIENSNHRTNTSQI